MKNSEKTINQIMDLGIKEPLHPSGNDIDKIFKACVITEQISKELLLDYIKLIKQSSEKVKEIHFYSEDSRQKTLEQNIKLIDKAIEILGRELDKEIPDSNRKEIYRQIKELIGSTIEFVKVENEKSRESEDAAVGAVVLNAALPILAFGAVALAGYGIYKYSKNSDKLLENLMSDPSFGLLEESF